MPETIGTLIVGAIAPGALTGIGLGSSLSGATFLGINIATAVGTAAIIGASIGLQYATRPGLPKASDGTQPIKQAVPPRLRGYGRCRIAGYYMLYEENGKVSYDVVALHSGRMSQIVTYLLHDDTITIDPASGNVNDDYSDGRYGPSKITIRANIDGTGGPFFGDSGMDAVFSPSTHFGYGVSWLSLACLSPADANDFPTVYPHGLPVPSVIADLAPIWDPRDPSQDRNSPGSWKVSYNPVIQLIDYLTATDGGMGLDFDTILPAEVLALWMAEADICDALVERADGTFEKRYQSSGWYLYDNKPEDVIGAILATCDGWLAESGDGTLSLTVGLYRDPDITISDKHIVGFSLNYGQADESTVNQLDISFTDTTQKYAEVQADSLRDEDAISLTGIVRSQQLDLKWVQEATQARRLAYRAMDRLNAKMSGSFTTTLYGLKALGKRWVRLQYPFISGLQDCVVEIQDGTQIDLMAGQITFKFNRIAPDEIEAYDPEADEGTIPTPPPIVVPPDTNFELREDGSYELREDGTKEIRESA
ncbi:MAG: hypothetical protein J0H40_17685 [Rhizobiales bacterium]|nr:hypothetical protein [Hyphomicrobiales bacterium]